MPFSHGSKSTEGFALVLRPASAGAADAKLLSAQEVSKLLGISSRTLWTHTSRGSIPHLRIGRRVLYPADAVASWIEANTSGGKSGGTA